MRVVARTRQYHEPSFVKFFFGSPYMAPAWFLLRVAIGWQWLTAGLHKVTGQGWMNHGGYALASSWSKSAAIPKPPAKPTITYGWYRDFLQFMLDHHWAWWFAKVVAMGEVLVGLGLIVGALTAIAAFFGMLMNFNFMLAGSSSTNPVLFAGGVLLILAWKVAGQIGADRWLLGLIGTPWEPGKVFHLGTAEAPVVPERGAGSTPA